MADWFDFSIVSFDAALYSLGIVVAFALAGWLLSLAKNDVSIVDSLWSLMFLVSLATYMTVAGATGWRAWLVLALVAVWALRLSAHITWRGWGEPEDHRYQEIRANNQPNFRLKSVYIVFGLQAVLAWLISFPLLAAVAPETAWTWLDSIALALWLAGMVFESVADAQLERFKRNPDNRGKVLRSGLWRYSRHPNYFGEFLLQWGFFLFAVSAGGAWTIFAPVLISFLLLRVSGVTLLEKDISERRPEYQDYIKSTNAFFPGKPGSGPGHGLFVGLLMLVALPCAANTALDQSYDRKWEFEVLVNDKPVGHHRFYLDSTGRQMKVWSVADFEYRLMFLTLYEYRHENHETWESSCLSQIESRTDANGKKYAIEGRLDSGSFVVENDSGRQELPECVSTFAYWDPSFLRNERLLNGQTGEFMAVEVSEPVNDSIMVRGVEVPAERYRLVAGEIAIDLWYDQQQKWLGLETRQSEDRRLRYVLQ